MHRFVCQRQYQGEPLALAFDTPHEFHLETQKATRPELRNGTATLFAMQQFELLRVGLLFSRLAHSRNSSCHQNGNAQEQNHGCQHIHLWRNSLLHCTINPNRESFHLLTSVEERDDEVIN